MQTTQYKAPSHCEISSKLNAIRLELRDSFPSLNRISVAVYHEERGILQTYVYSEEKDSHLQNYEARLADCNSLLKLAAEGEPRIVNDMSIFDNSTHKHSQTIKSAGYQASYTMPMLVDGQLLGFIFANSYTKNVLTGELLQRLKLVTQLIESWISLDFYRVGVLKSTIASMKMVADKRDPETAEHQLRMANYSLLIARKLADKYGLNDVQIANMYLYFPLHDLGKIAIADNILLKPARLNSEEFSVMKTHTTAGADLVTKLIALYNLTDIPYISMLTNIIRFHHEKLDGSGYPDGLRGDEIPIEARITMVADIFDALTSVRPYKSAWSNEAAFCELRRLAGKELAKDCIDALYSEPEQILAIQKQYADDAMLTPD